MERDIHYLLAARLQSSFKVLDKDVFDAPVLKKLLDSY
jgi:hypothetical protein